MARTVLPDDPEYLKVAFSLLGTVEWSKPGRHNPDVLEMYASSGHPDIHDDETPWCAAFVGHCLKMGGLPNTQSLMARSYLQYGTPVNIRGSIPRGAIAIWPRGRPPSAHTNFVLEDTGTHVICIGGNQSKPGTGGAVTFSREAKAHALGFRLPKQIAKPVKIVDEPEHQPDDPGVEEEEISSQERVPWYKRTWAKVTGGIGIPSLLGGASFSVDAHFVLALCALAVVGTICYLVISHYKGRKA